MYQIPPQSGGETVMAFRKICRPGVENPYSHCKKVRSAPSFIGVDVRTPNHSPGTAGREPPLRAKSQMSGDHPKNSTGMQSVMSQREGGSTLRQQTHKASKVTSSQLASRTVFIFVKIALVMQGSLPTKNRISSRTVQYIPGRHRP